MMDSGILELDGILEAKARQERKRVLMLRQEAELSRYLVAASALSMIEDLSIESVDEGDDGGELEEELPLDLAPG
jgi:hypothetical protein